MSNFTIAIAGGGPRGLAVAERLVLRLVETSGLPPVHLVLIDDHQPGAGRIWRDNQSPQLLMNTMAGQFTLFSGPGDGGPVRPGHGPSLYEWMRDFAGDDHATANSYASRRVGGRYMQFVLAAIQAGLPRPHCLTTPRTRIVDAKPRGSQFVLRFERDRSDVTVDALVLATGHAAARLTPMQRQWAEYSESSRHCCFLPGNSAADLDLDPLQPAEPTGVIGLGLGFHDILARLTVDRGGRFEEKRDKLVYIPSGDEPCIAAGSRSGLPIPARGVNQKPRDWQYEPRFFHARALEAARRTNASGESESLSFLRDVYPLILTETEHVYLGTWARWLYGDTLAQAFLDEHAGTRDPRSPMPTNLLRRYGLNDVPHFDLHALARPFDGSQFESPREFDAALKAHVQRDLQEAQLGNVGSPVKAACDMLRDVRDILRSAVEFGSLDADSFEQEFQQGFAPVYSLLTAGPPVIRVQQLLALHAAGIVKFVGPKLTVECDYATDRFCLSSPVVNGSQQRVTALIDSRIPLPSLLTTGNGLLQNLLRRGLIRPYCRQTDSGRATLGGVEVLPGTFHVVARDGTPHRNLFAIGLPTESPRWFTQVGSGAPGKISRFTADASAVADNCIRALLETHHQSFHQSKAA